MADVKGIRAQLGLSQPALAAKLGVHQSTVSRWENGSLPVEERTALALEALRSRATEEQDRAVIHCGSCGSCTVGEIAACTSVGCPCRQKEAA